MNVKEICGSISCPFIYGWIKGGRNNKKKPECKTKKWILRLLKNCMKNEEAFWGNKTHFRNSPWKNGNKKGMCSVI